MNVPAADLANTGLEVIDLQSDSEFAARRLHPYDAAMQLEGLRRLAGAFVEDSETILQELVNAAIELCGADSAGISIERTDEANQPFYHWVATAGLYSRFVDAKLPPYPSACGVCLQRGQPQLFRVSKTFFDLMGIEAELVMDGILIPWQVDEMRGTIWIIAHERAQAFDLNDCRLMQSLANFAAMGVRQQRQRQEILAQAKITAAAAMANELAHNINNPLQSLTNLFYLASQGSGDLDSKILAQEASGDLERLTQLVRNLLAGPVEALRRAS